MNNRRDFFMAALAVMLSLAFFGLIAALFLLDVPEGNKDLLTVATGVLFSGASGAWGFYFGSSQGSADKSDIIAERMQQDQPTKPAQ